VSSLPMSTRSRWSAPILIAHLLLLLGVLLVAAYCLLLTTSPSPGDASEPITFRPSVHRRTGVNVSLQQYGDAELDSVLSSLGSSNLLWVRQRFPWVEIEPHRGQYEWEDWDRIVDAAARHGVNLIAVLDTSPAWARSEADQSNPLAPPHERSDFGGFASAIAQRYGQQLTYYQVWDEPNIAPHWGHSVIDAADYMGLLREGFLQINAADPGAFVLSAGLAPTIEESSSNLSDLIFLYRLYEAGGADWFDIAAAKPYGFSSHPLAMPSSAEPLSFQRVSQLREVMVRSGDSQTPLWGVEFGWNALPDGWSETPSIWGQVDATDQAEYLQQAYGFADSNWPWMGPMVWASYEPDLPLDDPRWGFALVDERGSATPALGRLQAVSTSASVLHPGVHAPDHPGLNYQGNWRVTPDAADIGQSGDVLEFDFSGTKLDLDIQRGDYWAYLNVTIDGQPANALPSGTATQSTLILHDPLNERERVTLASGLQATQHSARIVAEGGWGQWAIRGIIVSHEVQTWPAWLLPLLAVLFLATLVSGTRFALRDSALLEAIEALVGRVSSRFRDLPEFWQIAAVFIPALLLFFSPWLVLDLLSLLVLGILLVMRLDLALPLIAFSLPFFVRPKHLMGLEFSLTEIVTLLALVAALLHVLARWVQSRQESERFHSAPAREAFREMAGSVSSLDWAVLSLVIVSAMSIAVAGNRGVAQREFRVVILEASLFYLLVSRTLRTGNDSVSVWPTVDALSLGATVVSLVGLWQLVSGQGRIDVEGVWRVRAFYGSPNNLGLYLDRVLPLLAAVVAFGRSRHRRWIYGLMAGIVGTACFFTFSKGALLLGLPAAALFLGIAGSIRASRDRRWRPLLLAGAVLLTCAVAIVPLFTTERFSSLFDFQQGTSFFRLQLWRGALNMALDHPILGVGLDNFLYEYRTHYVLPAAWEELSLSHPHNIVLDFWTRLGVLGLASGLWLFSAAFPSGWRAWWSELDLDRQALLLGLLASLVATVAHGLIDNSIFLVDLAYVFMLTLGLFRHSQLQYRIVN